MQVGMSDPSVRIPAAARAAAAKAEEIHKSIYGGVEPPQETKEDNEKPENTPAPSPDLNPESLAKPKEEAPPAEAKDPPVTPPAEGADEETYEHKFKSMKGRFMRSERMVNELTDQVTSLRQENEALRRDLETSRQPAEPARAATRERLVTPKEEEDYGQELLQVVGKKAREELSPEVAELRAQVADLEARLSNVGTTVTMSARDKMIDTLDQRCPTWQEINTNPRFISWLQLQDKYSGAIRHELLKAAWEQNQSPRVLAFFDGFLAEEAATVPAEPEPAPQPDPGRGKIPLETFAAPGRAKSAASSQAPAEKPYFTSAQISQFYVDVAAGKYRGKEAEKDRIERQIFEAGNEGRVR